MKSLVKTTLVVFFIAALPIFSAKANEFGVLNCVSDREVSEMGYLEVTILPVDQLRHYVFITSESDPEGIALTAYDETRGRGDMRSLIHRSRNEFDPDLKIVYTKGDFWARAQIQNLWDLHGNFFSGRVSLLCEWL